MMDNNSKMSMYKAYSNISCEYWGSAHRQAHRFPEQDLLLAILKDALLSYRKNRTRASKQAHRMYKHDRVWFFGHDTERLCSFESVCDALGLSSQRIRQQLISLEK